MANAGIGVAAIFTLALLAGCATPPPADDKEAVAAYNEANDPIEPLNRYFFELNRFLDHILLRPVAEIYRGILPEGARRSVRNVSRHLDTPFIFANDLLQGEVERASDSFGRFATNSFFGVGGLFDVAAGDNPNDPDAGIPFHNEDLGQTLAVWGAGPGPYLMLPIIGPSNVRDGLGRLAEFYADPMTYAVENQHRTGFSLARSVVRGIDIRSRNIESFDEIERGSIDFYATVRSLYRQHRASEIANGRGPENPLPEMGDALEKDDKAERVSSNVK
ncbi:MAG: VacJ family lipoprotein [Proteobacteria bacterium]|nr:VacJ family lipoprotein [Pseudomonadota bacterium]